MDESALIERYRRQQPTLRAILDRAGILNAASVLDYGCGLGGWLWPLTGERLYGFDVDAQLLERAPEYDARPTYISELPDDLRVDAAICVSVLQLLTGRELHALFARIEAILAPGGRFLAMTVNPWKPIEWVATGARLQADRFGGHWYHALLYQRNHLRVGARALVRRTIEPDDDTIPYAISRRQIRELAARQGLVTLPLELGDLEREYDRSVRQPRALPLPHYQWSLFAVK